MNYIKTYESFNDGDLQIIKDILLELEDDGFDIEYHYDNKFSITHIFIRNKNTFYLCDNIKQSLIRISNFLGSSICGFWRYGTSGEQKFYIYSDEREIRTGGNKMDKNWPIISAMRLLIHH